MNNPLNVRIAMCSVARVGELLSCLSDFYQRPNQAVMGEVSVKSLQVEIAIRRWGKQGKARQGTKAPRSRELSNRKVYVCVSVVFANQLFWWRRACRPDLPTPFKVVDISESSFSSFTHLDWPQRCEWQGLTRLDSQGEVRPVPLNPRPSVRHLLIRPYSLPLFLALSAAYSNTSSCRGIVMQVTFPLKNSRQKW